MELVGIWRRAWQSTWPKLAAVAVVLVLWQLTVLSGWRPRRLLPEPATVLIRLGHLLGTTQFFRAVAITLARAAGGFLLALAAGSLVGVACALSPSLRSAIGSLITGLQSFPSIIWAPFALLVFTNQPEQAILFVVVMGAAPSIAHGLISGVDHVPPATIQAGRILGAGGFTLYRMLVLPASFPYFIAGLSQGWAYGWRSLMSAELIVVLADRPSLGTRLQFARVGGDMPTLLGLMIVILVIGIAADQLFGWADRRVRQQHGLVIREAAPA
ncbi:MAG: ABC transporter permease subunit [Candidatus Dormibacteraeota bacterium]|nr:ABC transporter permease subunit [Candidatus Dormibacteraeota bacterium]